MTWREMGMGLGGFVVSIMVVLAGARFAYAQSDTVAINIPAQELSTALTALAEQTQVQLLYASELARGLTTKGVSGTVTLDEAVRQLLEGTGLQHTFTDAKTVTLQKAPVSAAAGHGEPASGSEPLAERKPIKLPEVKITADWLGVPTPEVAKKHPGARTVITNRELTESGARTVEDALRKVPGVRVFDETGTGVLPNIGVRGLSPLRSEQVLVLVDGIPITLAPYGQTGLSLFPLTLNTVESIDVARGGVAVHYGPNNVGGVINFVTKQIPRTPTVTAKETLSVAGTGRMLTDSYVRAGGFVSDKLGLQVQANVINGDSVRAHSQTSVNNVTFDANWFVTNNADIKAGLQYYETQNDLPGALTPQSYARDRNQSTRPLDRFNGDTLRGHFNYNYHFGNGAEFSWTNFSHRSNRQFFFGNATNADTVSTLKQSSPRNFLVYGSEPRFTFTLARGIKQKIAVGARYMREEVDFLVDARNLATGAYTVSRNYRFENHAVAAYLSDTFTLLDGKLKITPGIRMEQINLDFRNNLTGAQTRNPTTDWLPGLDLGYQASDAVFLFANFHESLRSAQFTQIAFSGGLDAERAKNYEAGIRLNPTKQIDTSFTVFRFDFDNKLEFVSQAAAFRNLGKAYHQGGEVELAWRPEQIRGLEFKIAYAYVDTKQLSGTTQGKELPLAPHHQLNPQVNYRDGNWNWNLNGLYQSAAFSDGANTVNENASGSIGKIPSYSIWNTQVTHDFRWSGAKMKAGLALNNMFNEEYYLRGIDFSQGRMPGLGRTVLLTLQMDL
jgi:Fe(3+) dicitrate transport protein